MPSLESTHMQNELIAAAVRSTAILSIFPLHPLANGDITVPPPGNVDVGMGMYPSSIADRALSMIHLNFSEKIRTRFCQTLL